MKEAQRKYKKKIIRKYVEIYPNDSEVIIALNVCKCYGVSFNRYIKELMKIDAGSTALILWLNDTISTKPANEEE